MAELRDSRISDRWRESGDGRREQGAEQDQSEADTWQGDAADRGPSGESPPRGGARDATWRRWRASAEGVGRRARWRRGRRAREENAETLEAMKVSETLKDSETVEGSENVRPIKLRKPLKILKLGGALKPLKPLRREGRERVREGEREGGLGALSEGWEVFEGAEHLPAGNVIEGHLAVAALAASAAATSSLSSAMAHRALPIEGVDQIAAIRRPPAVELEVVLMFSIALLMMLGAQVMAHTWKRQHLRSFHMVTLIFLWVVPPICALQLYYWNMLIVWCGFSSMTWWMMSCAMQRPMHVSIPRMVYLWFTAVYRFCMCLGCLGYFIFMVNILFALAGDEGRFTSIGGELICCGLYYGVMGRDFAEICADFMASRSGFASSRWERSRVKEPKELSPDTCAMCSQEVAEAMEEGGRAITLPCSHSFHEVCLRGWRLVGKRDMCPYCMEKVDFRGVFPHPWAAQPNMWNQVLDAARYLVVWTPLLVISTQITLYFVTRPR